MNQRRSLPWHHLGSRTNATTDPPSPPSQAPGTGLTLSAIQPTGSDSTQCQPAPDLLALLYAFEARLEQRVFFVENSLSQRLSSAESRITDLASCVSNIMSRALTIQATPVSHDDAPLPSLNSTTHQCHSSFLSPPTFGSTTLWSVFCRQFDCVAVLHSWPPCHKAQVLVAQICSAATEFLESPPGGGGASYCSDYERVISALESRYGDAHLQHLYFGITARATG